MTITSSNNKIMVVDDDPAIRHLISRFFSYNNYQIEAAADGKIARKLFRQFNPDLVILDVNLPDESGFNLCKEMRATGAMVIMLTSMTDTNSVLEGFEQGADDYLTKPFNLEILKAKIAALFNRLKLNRPELSNPTLNPPQKRLVFEQLVIDPEKCEATLNNQLIPLTALEFELLYFLASYPNRVWDRSELILAVWSNDNDDESVFERKVDVHIGQIRKKINDIDGKLIKTVRRKGYMFEVPIPEK